MVQGSRLPTYWYVVSAVDVNESVVCLVVSSSGFVGSFVENGITHAATNRRRSACCEVTFSYAT